MRLRTAFAGLLGALFACAPGDQTAPIDPNLSINANATVGSVTIIPGTDTIINLGGTAQLATVIKDNSGIVIPPGTVPVQWGTLSPTRVTVSPSGKVTSLVSSGQGRITATAGTRVDTALIIILARTPSATASSITVAPFSIAQTSGSAAITVTVRDAAGLPVPRVSVTLKSSGTGNIVGIPAPTDSNGMTTAKFSSTTIETKTITATANGIALARSATITVRSPLEAVKTIMSCVIPSVPAPGTVNLVTDVVYDSPGGVPQRLDVAWPKTAGVHPVLVLVHGGGWYKGDKVSFRTIILQLATRGYTAVAANYRLVAAGKNIFPAAVQDLRCALRWIRANAARYNLDPDRGAALGVSAGGHLAELLGLAPNATKLDGPCSVTGPMAAIKAVVAYAGPSDFRQSTLFTPLSLIDVTAMLGGIPENVPSRAALASPVTHASTGDPLALLVHGLIDSTVPSTHSSKLKTGLNKVGVGATYIPVQGVGHSIQPLTTTTAGLLTASCTTLEFLKQELQP
jgi:acetyl esterase/lipase